jgi:polyisoprenoid-binding protein YceI
MKLPKNSYLFMMLNKLSLLHLVLIIIPLLPACTEPKAKEKENSVSASSTAVSRVTNEKYVIDNKESSITYKGSMLLSSKGSHTGYVYLSKGELMVDNDQVVGGAVEVDMNTIEDKKHGRDNGLVNHLKDPDFFDVEKFPISTFVIAKVTSVNDKNVTITGKLTIKGITQTITFPAKIEIKDGIIHATGKVTIDRTQWGIRYKSGKFFGNLADEVISDAIEFDMKIVAKK